MKEKQQKSNLKKFSTEELMHEIARRQMGESQQHKSLLELEEGWEEHSRTLSLDGLREQIKHLESLETQHKKPCPCCGKLIPVKAIKRPRTIMSLHGKIEYARNYHYCDYCKYGFYPMDNELDIQDVGESSHGLNRRILDFAVNEVYSEAAERFQFHYGFSVSTCLVQNIVERVPTPKTEMIKNDLTSRMTIQADGSMVPMRKGDWQEGKLAVITTDDKHFRGNEEKRGMVTSAHYVATMQDVHGFEKMIHDTLPSSKTLEGKEVVFLADGAPWIWEMAKRLIPKAVQILDFPHAVQHGANCGEALLDKDSICCELWNNRIRQMLMTGQVNQLIKEMYACKKQTQSKVKLQVLEKEITYFERNRERMAYDEHRSQGRMIGSGIVESGHRHVIQKRMKLAGQHWSLTGAEKMIRLRACYKNVGPENFYDNLRMAA